MNLDAPTGRRGGRSLQRLVRRLVVMLLGERNAENLYGEDDATEKFKAEAKRKGMTVVSGDLVWPVNLGVQWMVDPLANSEKEQGEKKQYQVALWNGLRVDGNGGDGAGTADDGEGVPPSIYLQPGEWIAHVMVKPPNDPSSATGTQTGAALREKGEQ